MTKFGSLIMLASADTGAYVVQRYEEYLQSKRDYQAEADTLYYLLTKNADRDRSRNWRASSAGTCLRAQQFAFQGREQADVSSDGMNIFANGDYVHLRWQVAGLIDGWLSDAEVPVTYGTNVRGTMDGLLSDGNVLEIKSINSRGFAQVTAYGAKEAHKKQATAYMICIGATRTHFVYENKDTNVRHEIVYDLDPEVRDAVLTEWNVLDALMGKKMLNPMLHDCLNQRGVFKWCRFHDFCEKAKFHV